jgi:crossover junction endodeoxyribonuclease RuvC
MKHVMGLDPSLTATGLIVLDELGAIAHRQLISSEPSGPLVSNRLLRYSGLINHVLAEVRRWSPEVICIEGYSLGSNMPGMVDRVEFGGVLRWSLVAARNRLIEVAPSTLKKWATGKGAFSGGGKTPLIVAMTSRYGVELGTDDEYDAYALARMAHQIAELSQPKTEFQRIAIELVVNPPPKKKKASRRRGAPA